MIYRIYPQKDTTIYEDSTRKFQNVGKDEVGTAVGEDDTKQGDASEDIIVSRSINTCILLITRPTILVSVSTFNWLAVKKLPRNVHPEPIVKNPLATT